MSRSSGRMLSSIARSDSVECPKISAKNKEIPRPENWGGYLAKPYESQADWDISNDHSESEYISSISNSAAANAALTAIVNLSNQGKHIFIGCYDYNVKRSHLSTLFDIMEDLFLEEAPELRMMGG